MSGIDQLPELGATIMTSDEQELGIVKELSGACFKIDAPGERDYWLHRELVRSIDGDRATLEITGDAVEDFKLNEPRDVPSESPVLSATEESFGSEAERHEKRHEMTEGYPDEVYETGEDQPHAATSSSDQDEKAVQEAGVLRTREEQTADRRQMEGELEEQRERRNDE